MKFQLKFQYPVSFKPHRAIKPRSTFYVTTGDIEIPEVPRSSVRTVFRVGTLPNPNRNQSPAKWTFEDAFCAKPDGSLREIVTVDGALFVESVSVDEATASLAADSLKHGLFGGIYLGIPHDAEHAGKARSRSELEQKFATPFREYNDDGGEKVKRRLDQRAQAFIAIDEKIYVRCHEPVLYIDQKYGPSSVKFGKSATSYQDSDLAGYSKGSAWDGAKAHYYNLAEAGIGLAALKRRYPDEEVETIAVFEIVDPSAIRQTPHVNAVVALAHEALDELWRHPMSLLPDAVESAVKLRDTLSESGDQITPQLLRALEVVASLPELSPAQLDRWKQLAETRPKRPDWSGDHNRGSSEASRASEIVTHHELRTKAAEFARAALRRFEARPVGMSWEDRALGLNSLQDPESGLFSVELLSQGKVIEFAGRLSNDAAPLLDEVARGGRVFAIEKQEQYSTSIIALLSASMTEGGLEVQEGIPEHRALIERHISSALALEPHLAPDQAPALEMIP